MGFLGHLDRRSGAFEPLTFGPEYLRGPAFVGAFAVVGFSKPRENRTFSDLLGCPRGVRDRCNMVAPLVGRPLAVRRR